MTGPFEFEPEVVIESGEGSPLRRIYETPEFQVAWAEEMKEILAEVAKSRRCRTMRQRARLNDAWRRDGTEPTALRVVKR
jgi:hypothetical protein